MNPMLIMFFQIVYTLLNIYFFMIIAYVLLSWIPEIRNSNFYAILHQIVDPYMRVFRGILVFGGMDFTPIIGLMILRFFLLFMNSFMQTL